MRPNNDQSSGSARVWPTSLDRLAEAIRVVESGGRYDGPSECVRPLMTTGWDDGRGGIIGGLAYGGTHEWCGSGGAEEEDGRRGADGWWFPPLTLMVHLAWRAMDARERELGAGPVAGVRAGLGDGPRGKVVWIGRRCWPSVHALVRAAGSGPSHGPAPPARARSPEDRRLLHASIFIDPPDDASRVWAIDLALRTGEGVACVVADGSGLDMAASRRLQLAAEAGGRVAHGGGRGGLGLILRPSWERRQISAATTRWLVRAPGKADAGVVVWPRWAVEVLRCKGVGLSPAERREWMLEDDGARGVVCVLPRLVDRPAASARAAG